MGDYPPIGPTQTCTARHVLGVGDQAGAAQGFRRPPRGAVQERIRVPGSVTACACDFESGSVVQVASDRTPHDRDSSQNSSSSAAKIAKICPGEVRDDGAGPGRMPQPHGGEQAPDEGSCGTADGERSHELLDQGRRLVEALCATA